MYTLDTNVLIYFLKGDPGVAEIIKAGLRSNTRFFISTITELELFAYPELAPDEMLTIDQILQTLTLVPLSSQVARTAAYFKRQYHTSLPDSVIAATAYLSHTIVLSRNFKDFRRIKEIRVKKT